MKYTQHSRGVRNTDIKNTFSLHTTSGLFKYQPRNIRKDIVTPTIGESELLWIGGTKTISDPSIFISLCESLVLTN